MIYNIIDRQSSFKNSVKQAIVSTLINLEDQGYLIFFQFKASLETR